MVRISTTIAVAALAVAPAFAAPVSSALIARNVEETIEARDPLQAMIPRDLEDLEIRSPTILSPFTSFRSPGIIANPLPKIPRPSFGSILHRPRAVDDLETRSPTIISPGPFSRLRSPGIFGTPFRKFPRPSFGTMRNRPRAMDDLDIRSPIVRGGCTIGGGLGRHRFRPREFEAIDIRETRLRGGGRLQGGARRLGAGFADGFLNSVNAREIEQLD
ncbi:hypothetical protein CC1G_10622 [Coprinopsis cinerea okayama7|uniref:Uncharacterized protein n=1 Tax=Coprinopsis cinerea (strain Okayama-7 / 130 / ATCC MYA-4618 / FGSC 9003) TaxID=240176 RepID=A8P8S8_COPC7|nr:hypothetical protein CC1G_10622 [Coprinopsis cinerea okayama7\|eukprot:XP_001839629.1 hypothetical protein CC1G_10622 [Coprinopsis cinerea okayama7\